jgi:fucose 4-O-acetylase-like acetyltransferase
MFLTEKFSWLFLASVLILGFVSNIKINDSLKKIITKISTASLFIYLTHFQWASLYRQISPYESKTMELIFALIGGVFLNIIYSKFWNKLKNLTKL